MQRHQRFEPALSGSGRAAAPAPFVRPLGVPGRAGRMSLRERVLAGMVVVNLAIAAAAGLLGYFLSAGVDVHAAANLHANRISLSVAVAEALVELDEMAAALQEAVRRNADPAPGLAGYRRAISALQQQTTFLAQQFPHDGARLRAMIAAGAAELQRRAQLPPTEESARALLDATLQVSGAAGRELATLVKAENLREADAVKALARERRAQLSAALLAVAVALGLSLMLCVAIHRSLMRRLGEVSRGLNQVLAGRALQADLQETDDEFGEIVRAIRKLRAQGDHIRRLAYGDAITGLPNRNSLDVELRDVHRLRSTTGSHGLVLVGIDTYNNARNAFGVRFAEEMMRSLVRHLGTLDDLPTTLFRYDAGTFAILVDRKGAQPVTRDDLKRVAGEAFRRLSSPAQVRSERILVSASVGGALFPDDARDPDELVSICGEVLRQASAEGTGQLRFGERGLTERLRHQLALSEQIRVGIRDGHFEPFFQPIIDVESQRVVGAEILTRWRHPDGRVVLPGEFIVVAEETELIRKMTDAVLIEACRVARLWMDSGLDLTIAFNLSARMLTPSVVNVVRNALDTSGLPPRRLLAEVTETALLSNLEEAHEVLEELRQLGVRICLDDFGTGYSSLSHLYRFRIERIKIDPVLTRAATEDTRAAEIVRAMVELAQRIDIQLVAEGIETDADQRVMRGLGVRYMQGYHFSRALPHQEFQDWAQRYPGR